ncbi:MAG: dienelactone hydrolase family protein [Alphaproteobacteria bacterium]|nr:MAG: dienelactone hydrolase family protein [Alphaproteobacteria bacterium]
MNGGPPRQLVVLLHGLGDTGEGLIGLAHPFRPLFPDAEFIAPDAPWPHDMLPFGRQWFSLRRMDPAFILDGVQKAAPILDAFLDQALSERGLTDKDLILIGFSQGTMMSLYVGPRRASACAAIIGFSGMLVGPELMADAVASRPPVLLVHGADDEVLTADASRVAAKVLEANGFQTELVICPNLPHSIDNLGVESAARFLQAVFKQAN